MTICLQTRGITPFLKREVQGSENMITFVAEGMYPNGFGIICSVAFQAIFREDGTTDLELTFLATKSSAEGNGVAIWLIHQVIRNDCMSVTLSLSPGACLLQLAVCISVYIYHSQSDV